MHKEQEFSKSALTLIALVAAFAVLLVGLNFLFAPLIAKNGAAEQFAPLYSVMPDASGFEVLYDAGDSAASELKDVPETVQGIYSEKSGLGYVLRLSTTEGYTGEPIEFTMAVDAGGKISGIELTAYPDTKDFGADYPGTYVGQDSALADVSLVASVTYSSSAFKNAVSDGFAALVSNGLVGAGEKGAEQLLMELLVTEYPGIANDAGVLQYEELELASGEYQYIQKAMKALNGSGIACIAVAGDNTLLAVCNLAGSCKLVDSDGQDVSADPAYADLIAEVTALTAENTKPFAEAAQKKLQGLVSEGASFTELSMNGVFSSVTSAFAITDGGAQYYGFAARTYGYSNEIMTIYCVLDAQGAIVSMTADELILYAEYFSDYELDEAQYKTGFAGLTADSWTGEQALISGATASSGSVKAAISDIFAAYQTIVVNGGASNEG